MGFQDLLHNDSFVFLQSVGIIVTLVFNAIALTLSAIAQWMQVRSNRATNLLEITKQHRDVWTWIHGLDSKRIAASSADLNRQPLTDEERLAVNFLILHLAGNYRASKVGMFKLPSQIPADITRFLSRPIPEAVWDTLRMFHEKDFIRFVEKHRATRPRE